VKFAPHAYNMLTYSVPHKRIIIRSQTSKPHSAYYWETAPSHFGLPREVGIATSWWGKDIARHDSEYESTLGVSSRDDDRLSNQSHSLSWLPAPLSGRVRFFSLSTDRNDFAQLSQYRNSKQFTFSRS